MNSKCIFRSARIRPEHATWLHELDHPTKRGVVGQVGLVVMRWDFRLMVNGIVTNSVLQVKCFPTGLLRRSGQTYPQQWSYWRSVVRLSPIVPVYCNQSNSEGVMEHTGRREDDESFSPALRLLTWMHSERPWRIIAPPSSAACSHRLVRHIRLICAQPSWTPQMFCPRITWTHRTHSSGTQHATQWHGLVQLNATQPSFMPDAVKKNRGGMV